MKHISEIIPEAAREYAIRLLGKYDYDYCLRILDNFYKNLPEKEYWNDVLIELKELTKCGVITAAKAKL